MTGEAAETFSPSNLEDAPLVWANIATACENKPE